MKTLLFAFALLAATPTYPVTISYPMDYMIAEKPLGTTQFRIKGACSGLYAIVQGRVGIDWFDLPTTVSETGLYRVDGSGYDGIRLHIRRLQSDCQILPY